MLEIKIPGRKTRSIANAVFDFNGTLATDGNFSAFLKEKIAEIRERMDVTILSSDTFHTVFRECSGLGVRVEILNGENTGTLKKRFVGRIGPRHTLCVGNGRNDFEMFRICALSILVLGKEGCSAKTLAAADIVVKSAEDAMDLILNPARISATLRP